MKEDAVNVCLSQIYSFIRYLNTFCCIGCFCEAAAFFFSRGINTKRSPRLLLLPWGLGWVSQWLSPETLQGTQPSPSGLTPSLCSAFRVLAAKVNAPKPAVMEPNSPGEEQGS